MIGAVARTRARPDAKRRTRPAGSSPVDPAVMAANHDPDGTWDPVVDFQMMWRNVRGFMSLFHSEKPVRLQGPRLLRRRRDRHGALLRPAGDRGRRQDRLSAGARLGRADHRALGLAHRAGAGQAPAPDRRLDLRCRGGGVGARERVGARGRARRAVRGTARAGRPAADEPARDAQAAGQPGRSTRRAFTRPRSWARSSTASPATRPRAMVRAAGRGGRAGARRFASATSPSATRRSADQGRYAPRRRWPTSNPEITAESIQERIAAASRPTWGSSRWSSTDERCRGPDHGRRPASSPGAAGPRRGVGGAGRLGRGVADVPPPAARPRLHDGRDEAERVRRRAGPATS